MKFFDQLKRSVLLAVLFSFVSFHSNAQKSASRWEKNIVSFEEQDKVNPPKKKNLIVFTGSSSIVGWKTLAQDFPDKNVINRGFGGSQTSDLIQYADRVVSVYKPKQVFIYEGDNDIAGGKNAETVFQDFTTLFNKLRKSNKKMEIVFISIKPSPSRKRFMDEMVKANALIKQFIEQKKKAKYVDIYTPMLDKEGNTIPELYLKDKLHMTAAGYKIWADTIRPYLK